MKTTLDLPDELMREAKIRAAAQGKKLKEIVEETMRAGFAATPLNRNFPQNVHFTDSQLPNFQSPHLTHPSVFGLDEETGFLFIRSKSNAPIQTDSFEDYQQIVESDQVKEDLERAGISF